MASVIKQCPDLLGKSKPASLNDIKERVEKLQEESLSQEAAAQVERIARVLKQEKKKE